MPQAAVAARSLTKVFGAARAVDGLTLEVAAGEVYGLLGPNGAGKTTALRMLAGLLAPTSGRITIAGVDMVAKPAAAKARIGFITGSTGLYARLTPREILTYFGRVYGLNEAAVNRRVDEMAVSLGIGPLLDRRAEGLSTGEKQRVSLARALLPDPPVLILDEPSNGLDVVASRFLRSLVRAERERGKGIIFSTHYLAEAELVCDRVGLLHRGRMLREGVPAALRAETSAPSLEEAFLRLVEAQEAAEKDEMLGA